MGSVTSGSSKKYHPMLMLNKAPSKVNHCAARGDDGQVRTDATSSTGFVTLPKSKPVSASAAMRPRGDAASRKDKPEVSNKVRGDKKRGLEIASNPSLLNIAMAKYEKDTRSAGDTSASYVKTWSEYHSRIDWSRFGLPWDEPVIPLTPLKIAAIGSILKEADYRSSKNYLTSIKNAHILEGHPWPHQLELAQTRYNLSTTRGMGPGRQSEPLSFEKLANVDANNSIKNPRYPIRAGSCAVIFILLTQRT